MATYPQKDPRGRSQGFSCLSNMPLKKSLLSSHVLNQGRTMRGICATSGIGSLCMWHSRSGRDRQHSGS